LDPGFMPGSFYLQYTTQYDIIIINKGVIIMRKRFRFIIPIILMSLLTSCTKDKPIETTPTSDVVENKIEKIVATNTKDEFCYVGDTYKPSVDVVINAVYTDKTTKDVTSACKFSSISTESSGSRTVKVTYESFTTTYLVTVKNPDVSYLSIDTSNVKQTYNLGEKLDLTNLVVKAHFVNNTSRIITNYSYVLTDEDNQGISTASISRVGNLDVKISYSNVSISFRVFCVGNYDQAYTMRYQALNDLYDTASGAYKFDENDEIMKSPYLTFSAGKDTSLNRVNSKNEALNEKYNDVEYFEGLKLGNTNGLKFVLTHDGIVNFLVKSEEESKLLISETSSEETQKTIYESITINKKLKEISIYLHQGIYTINSNKSNLYLFETNVYLYDANIEDVHTYKALELVTTNVKKDFVDEAFNSDNLYLKGIYGPNKYDSISKNDYRIELVYDDKVYDAFLFSGKYIVNVIYQGINPSFDYLVSYEVNYKNSKQLLTNQFEYLRINGVDVTFGTTESTDIIGNVQIENTSKVTVTLKLLDEINSVCLINGKEYESLMELDVQSGDNQFEFSVEYRDSDNKTVYFIKYQIIINVK